MSLASVALIALAIPLGVFAVRQPQILSSLAAPKPLDAPPTSTCRVTGCNNELCVDADYVPLNSDCSNQEKFSCYQQSACVLKSNDECGFVISPEIQTCLDQNGINTDPNQSFITTSKFTTGKLNQSYSDTISTSMPEDISILSINELPPGISATCSVGNCTISGIPTQTGRYQIVVLAENNNGQIEQKLIPLTIRTGGTLRRN